MNGYKRMAMVLKALAHPARLQILRLLEEEGEACVCHMEKRLHRRQAYISQHLAKLREAGLVEDRREGLNVFYALASEGIDRLLEQVEGMAVGSALAEGEQLTLPDIRRISPKQCGCPKCEGKIELAAAKG